jgi:AraC family transcriptional regulator
MLIAGLCARYGCESSVGIPAQWQIVPHLGSIAGQVGRKAYRVMCNFDDEGNLDYTCGVEISDFSRVSKDWDRVIIPAQEYAVFTHRDHVSTIRSTWATIWNKWLPESAREVAEAPNFELYGADCDPVTGRGLAEIWVICTESPARWPLSAVPLYGSRSGLMVTGRDFATAEPLQSAKTGLSTD